MVEQLDSIQKAHRGAFGQGTKRPLEDSRPEIIDVVGVEEVGEEFELDLDTSGHVFKLRLSEETLKALYNAMLKMEISHSEEHQLLREWIKGYSEEKRNSLWWKATAVLGFALGGGALGIGSGFASDGIQKSLDAASKMLSQGGNIASPYLDIQVEEHELAKTLVQGDDSRNTNFEQRLTQLLEKLMRADEETRRMLLSSEIGQ